MRSLAIAWSALLLLLLATPPAWSQISMPRELTGGGDTQTPDQIPGVPEDVLDYLGPRRAATTSNMALPPLSGPVNPNTYLLGPGDLLRLQTWGRLSSTTTIQVAPEGVIIVQGIGLIRVAGRSLTSVRDEVVGKLKGQYRGVNVDLQLAKPRTFFIYLTGQVKNPGPVTATAANRVFDIIVPSLLQDNASRRRIEVLRSDTTRSVADLDLFTEIGDQSLNPYLRDGDVINVPVATDFVWAQGALARPQRFELGIHDSLLTLFKMAGDPIPAADVNRALLLRWKDPFTPESTWVRLDEVYARQTNPKLRDGDRVYVYYLSQYHLQHEAYVYGEVNRPGPYPIVEGKHHLSDLVSSAGGFLSTADLSGINVHRRAPGNEKDPELDRLLRLSRDQLTMSEYDALNTKLAGLREGYRVDWNRLKASPQELDLLLRDGDVVTVDRLVNSIRIDGQVKRPGILTFRTGQVVRDYVQQAGGFTDRAWTSRVRVTRAVTGQTLPAANVKSLDPGDFVWVPEKPDKTALDHFRETLTALAQVATVIIAIRTIR